MVDDRFGADSRLCTFTIVYDIGVLWPLLHLLSRLVPSSLDIRDRWLLPSVGRGWLLLFVELDEVCGGFLDQVDRFRTLLDTFWTTDTVTDLPPFDRIVVFPVYRNRLAGRWWDLHCFTPIGYFGPFLADCQIPKLESIGWDPQVTHNGVEHGGLSVSKALLTIMGSTGQIQ